MIQGRKKAEWDVSRHGGALIVKVSGLLTLQTANETRAIIRAALIEREAVKILVDVRRAVLLMSDEDHAELIRRIVQSRPFSAPLAVLATTSNWERMFQHCMGLMQTGRTRFAFASPQQACAWLAVPLEVVVPPGKEHREAA